MTNTCIFFYADEFIDDLIYFHEKYGDMFEKYGDISQCDGDIFECDGDNLEVLSTFNRGG